MGRASVFRFTLIGLSILFLSASASAQPDEGTLLFCIRKPIPNLDGFKAATGLLKQNRGRGRAPANWWKFYRYNIYTLKPDGTDFRQLTDDGMSRRPRWSPDGQWITYISGPENSQSLYVMTADGEEKEELLKRQLRIHDFWWSPSSHAILASVETDRSVDPMESWILTIDGESRKRRRMSKWAMGWFHWDAKGKKVNEPRTKLIRALPEEVNWPEWSPDRRYIAFVAEGRLSLADVESTGVTGNWFAQQNDPPCGSIEEWSRDGKRILFYVSGDVCAATVAKGRVDEIINLSMGPGENATWSPDGGRVAFVSRPAGRRNHEIYVTDVQSGDTKRITYTNYSHFNLDWK